MLPNRINVIGSKLISAIYRDFSVDTVKNMFTSLRDVLFKFDCSNANLNIKYEQSANCLFSITF